MKTEIKNTLNKALKFTIKSQGPDGRWDGPISSTLFQTGLTVYACSDSKKEKWYENALKYIESHAVYEKIKTRNKYAEKYYLQYEWIFHECARALALNDYKTLSDISKKIKFLFKKQISDERLIRKFLFLAVLLTQNNFISWEDVPNSIISKLNIFIENRKKNLNQRPWLYPTYLSIASCYLRDKNKKTESDKFIKELLSLQLKNGSWNNLPFITAFICSIVNKLKKENFKAKNYLLRWQNRDGGFSPFSSDIWATVFTMASIKRLKNLKNVFQKGKDFLIKKQHPNGGWPLGLIETPDFDTTGVGSYVLDKDEKAMSYLIRNQKIDGSWGTWNNKEESSVDVTAHCIIGLNGKYKKQRKQAADFLLNNIQDKVWYPTWFLNIYYGLSQCVLGIKDIYRKNEMFESIIKFLEKTQNKDGGWGDFPDKRSNAMGTANAILTLYTLGQESSNGVNWLIENQLNNGTWEECLSGVGPYPLRYSDHATTHASCVWALSLL